MKAAGLASRAAVLVSLLLATPRAGRPGSSAAADSKTDLREMAAGVLDRLQAARKEAGLPTLVRSASLDSVAERRARQVADLPFDSRMSPSGHIQKLVHDAGIRRYRAVAEHVEIQSGYSDPADAILRRWRNYGQDWSHVLDPSKSEIGLAAVLSDDGMIVFAAVLLSPAEPPPDPRALERDTERAINDARRVRGLSALAHSEILAEVARAHSDDMVKRSYFAHEDPDGRSPAGRVAARGISYSMMAENIAENSEAEDPVEVAVRGWLDSPPHRANLLNAAFLLTGVGVATSEDGDVVFTQLFLTPPASRER